MAATERDKKVTELDEPGAASQREPAAFDDWDDDDDEQSPRPTVVPTFDVDEYARDADDRSEVRARMATITDDEALEEAIKASRASKPSYGPAPDAALTAPPPPMVAQAIEESALGDASRVVAKAPAAVDEDGVGDVAGNIEALDFGGASATADAEVEVGDGLLDELDEDDQIAVLRDRLGPLTRVPRLSRPATELRDLVEDSKTAFALGFVDGLLPLEAILDVTGLPELDVLKIFDRLVANGAVVFR